VDQHTAYNQANAAARSDAVAAAIREATPESSQLVAMDYGCGPGHIGLRLADHFADVILVDPDPDALAQAATASSQLPNVTTIMLDLSAEAPPPGLRADVVFSCLSWHHVVRLDALLGALPHVAPGGRLFVADMDPDGGAYHSELPDFDGVDGFDRAELVGRLRDHSYQQVRIDDFWTGSKWIAGKLTPMSLFLLRARLPQA